MKINELLRIHEAPQPGTVLAYTTKSVIFRRYETISELIAWNEFSESSLLELHLFNREKEYRAIETEEKRLFDGSAPGTIEYVIEGQKDEDVLEEKILLEKESGTVTVKNYLHYNKENGMAVIDDFRLASEV